MATKKKMLSCRSCLHLGVAHYEADLNVKWNACMHPYFKELFTDGRALDLENEIIAFWCPKPEPRLEVKVTQPPDIIETKPVIEDNNLVVLENIIVRKPSSADTPLVIDEVDVVAEQENEVEVYGIFGKSPW